MSKNLYMHVMNGRPAYFNREHGMIFYTTRLIEAEDLFVKDLATIRRQQNTSQLKDDEREMEQQYNYGYLLIKRGGDNTPVNTGAAS